MIMRKFDTTELSTIERAVFVEDYRYQVRTNIFDPQGRMLDVRTAVAVVNTKRDNAIIGVMHPDSFAVNRDAIAEALSGMEQFAIYDPKGKAE